MRSAQSPAIDFNQMLVVSVFFHFFLFTVFMFLPQTQNIVKHVKPAFVDVFFVDVPTGPDMEPAPQQAEETPVAPLPQETPVVEKPVPKPKPVPEKPAVSKALVSKLDELARLEKKKTIPKKDKMAMAVPKPKDDLARKESEFERLSKKSATQQLQDKPKKKSSRLKALDELEKMNAQAHAALSKPKAKKTDSNAAELLKQLESIKKESVQIKVDTSKLSSRHSKEFKSGIRDLKITKAQRKKMASATSGELGDPGADALSLYLGLVKSKIDEHWKDPLGGGTGMVLVSFTIFPKGNIAMPKIVRSSGESKLDNLAIRAVKNAVPLPPFPREFKEPNLPLTLKFDYVPKN